MPDIPLPEDLSTYMRSMESRIRALETAPRAQDTSLPWVSDEDDGTFNTASLVAVDATPAGPTVTVNVGQTGNVLVTATAYIGLNSFSQTGYVDLYIDGSYWVNILAISQSATLLAANVSSSRVINGLTEGPHIFTLKYLVSGGNVNFSGRSLIVQTF